MGLLLYKSSEMFSSTELIRKSKMIFDKIINDEIDKAIIMRDGKPGFLLMDFQKYEDIMAEFEKLKYDMENISALKQKSKKAKKQKKLNQLLNDFNENDIENKEIKVEASKNTITPSIVIPPRPKTVVEDIIETNDEIIETESIEEVDQANTYEPTEEEEISQALKNISAINFDPSMKAIAEKKIKERILKARRERALLKEKEELENKEDLKEELEIQVHIKEANKKKERELKEFWD